MQDDWGNGNCKHQVEVEDSRDDSEKQTIHLYNNNDEWYVEIFRTREEVNLLIGKLRAAADEAFGPEKS